MDAMKRYLLYSLIALPVSLSILSALVLLSEGALMQRKYLEPWGKTYHQKFADPRTQILAHGILAANGHNLQSWKFVYGKDDPQGFDVYLETARLAPAVDPFHTQATISQGTLFEYASLAASKLGYQLKTDVFPDGEYAQNASVSILDRTRVAHAELVPAQPQQDVLYEEMFKPDTSRVAYQKGTLTPAQISALSAVELPQLRVEFVGNGEQYELLKTYMLDSARVETGVPAVMQETQHLFRINEHEKNKYRYGFSFEGSALPRFKMNMLQGLLTVLPSMNNTDAVKGNLLTQTAMAVEQNAGFFMIIAEHNTRMNQFNAGRLYSRMQLKAHSMNLAIQPLSQAIEEYPEMRGIQAGIHKDFVHADETILMLFRIGVPQTEVPRSMRMDVESFIRR
jgi:hypothetical protein